MTYDVEYLFVCSLTICVSSLVMYSRKSLADFFNGSFVFLLLNFESFLYILEYSLLPDVSFFNCVFQVYGSYSHTSGIVFPRWWMMEGTRN